MRFSAVLAATFVTTSAFADGGHGETAAMHHGLFSPLNGLEPLAAVAVFAVIAWAAWKRNS